MCELTYYRRWSILSVMNEKTISDNSRYTITSDGKVMNKKRGTYLKQQLNSKGYARVFLWYGDRDIPIAVHRLVATHFLRKRNGLTEVNHIDGNKLNNDVSNLEWCTRLQNVQHFHRHLR